MGKVLGLDGKPLENGLSDHEACEKMGQRMVVSFLPEATQEQMTVLSEQLGVLLYMGFSRARRAAEIEDEAGMQEEGD